MNDTLEVAERAMLLSLARDGDTFFDVGANVGVYSIAFAQRFPANRVIAFEPVDETRGLLLKNIAQNHASSVRVSRFGLSDNAGVATFYTATSDSGASSLAPIEEERFGPTAPVKGRTTTLDNLSVVLPPPNIIKCDVEGAELLVFRGAEKTLNRDHPIIQCEMLRKWAKRFNYHPNDLIAYLTQFGYQCYALRDNKLVPFPAMTDETVETNFYFLTEAHRDRMP
jgi:FkbM family methyltransferase